MTPGGSRPPLSHPLMPALVAAAVGVALYSPGIGAGFVGDDFMILHRLRQLEQPGDVLQFFRGEFFGYYRPLGFASHALDWALGGADPRPFHVTNLILHLVNTLLVFALGWRLAPGTLAGPIAALLFVAHAASHEPVMWISARFDLLASAFGLAAVLLTVSGRGLLAAGAFFLALLSKESAVALPLAAAGWAVFGQRRDARQTLLTLAPWLAALAVYAVLRQAAGGVSPIGGASRLPKLLVLGAALAMVVLLAGPRLDRLVSWLRPRRMSVLAAVTAAILAAGLLAASPLDASGLAADKLAVAGFVIANTFSPVAVHSLAPFYLDPHHTRYWLTGLLLALGSAALAYALWEHVLADSRLLFLLLVLLAALIPISALTEGTRYLYLPVASVCLMAGLLAARRSESGWRVVVPLVAAFALASAVQVSLKVRDWIWAGRMTAEGARLVDAALAPSCGEGHVVFLTAPVRIRGVYTHYYYETFAPPRGCQPGTFQVVARLLREDRVVEVITQEPGRVVLATPWRPGTVVLSRDLRTFDLPVHDGRPFEVSTPLGTVRSETVGDSHQLTMTFEEQLSSSTIETFYYSHGAIRRLIF